MTLDCTVRDNDTIAADLKKKKPAKETNTDTGPDDPIADDILKDDVDNAVGSSEEKDNLPDKSKGKETSKADNSNANVASIVPANNGPVRQTWRLISAVQAWPHSGFDYPQLVDYTHNNGSFLKPTVDMVNNKRVDLVWNHSDDAHDVAGYVENARWEESSDIPYGVNADLVVNPAYDSKAAVGLETGIIRNGSIGVNMKCKPSHPKMKFDHFIQQQGKVIDNEQVRWIPVKITDVRHMAIVPGGTGADLNAGRRVLNTSNAPENTQTEIIKNKETKGEMMEEWIALLSGLAKELGVEVAIAEGAELPVGLQDRLSKKIDNFKALNEKYNKLCVSVEKLGEMVCDGVAPSTFDETFNAVESKIAMAAHGEKVLDHYRKDATKWFDSAKVSLGKTDLSDTEKRMRGRIAKSTDMDYLEDVVAEYQAIAEANLSNKRVSEGMPIPDANAKTETSVIEDRRLSDIAAGVKRVYGE
jgi:hypothetical protein